MSLSKTVRQVLISAKCHQRSFQTTARILATEMVKSKQFLEYFRQLNICSYYIGRKSSVCDSK